MGAWLSPHPGSRVMARKFRTVMAAALLLPLLIGVAMA